MAPGPDDSDRPLVLHPQKEPLRHAEHMRPVQHRLAGSARKCRLARRSRPGRPEARSRAPVLAARLLDRRSGPSMIGGIPSRGRTIDCGIGVWMCGEQILPQNDGEGPVIANALDPVRPPRRPRRRPPGQDPSCLSGADRCSLAEVRSPSYSPRRRYGRPVSGPAAGRPELSPFLPLKMIESSTRATIPAARRNRIVAAASSGSASMWFLSWTFTETETNWRGRVIVHAKRRRAARQERFTISSLTGTLSLAPGSGP